MAFNFTFPDVGEGIQEGKIVKWKVKVGDAVKADQVLGEIETDKAVVEIPSPKAGTILALGGPEGGMIKVGETLALIGEKGEKATLPKKGETRPELEKEQKKEEPYTGSVVGFLEEASGVVEHKVSAVHETKRESGVKAMPAVRILAKKLGVDLDAIKGSGSDGLVTQGDVLAAAGSFAGVKRQSAEPPKQASSGEIKITRKYDLWGYVEHVPLTGMRKAIAAHVIQAQQNTVPVTLMDKVDVTDLVAVREKEKEVAEKKGFKLTYMPFIMKAVLIGLKENQSLNASIENDGLVLKRYYNIGFAVDTGDGLVVPVIKRVDQKSIFAIAAEMQQLAEKAREKKLDPMDMKGGSFTITNLGSLGGEYFTPVLNYPEAAILGAGKIKEELVVIEGEAKIRKMLPLSLTFDHRIVDGAGAAKFLAVVMQHLKDPGLMLVEDLV